MSRIPLENLKYTQVTLTNEKVFTLARLVSLLRCSSRTAQTKLSHWRTRTSYNQNGKYYTMPNVPEFNGHGLWHFEGKSFSMHGNLKKTVVMIIRNSVGGLSGDQIGKIVGISPQSFLHHFREEPGIRREKKCGLYIYFSSETDVYQGQIKNFQSITSSMNSISDIDAIMILVSLIKHHQITIQEILKLPEIRARNLSFEILQSFLEKHGLQKKNRIRGAKVTK